MFNQLLLWSLFIIPWFLLIFFDKKRVKRFMPAGLFSSVVLTILFQLAERLNWWEVKETIFPLTNTTPFIYSVYIFLPIIILYFTFHNFLKYMITNAIIDAIFAFGIMNWYEYLDIYQLKNINHFGIFLNTEIIAVLIYFYQKWQDEVFTDKANT